MTNGHKNTRSKLDKSVKMQKQMRKEKEKEFKQALITDAAKILFEEKSFEETTMEDIAAAAGFAKGTVYLYFKSKYELMANIVISAYDQLFDEIDQVAASEISAIEKMGHLTQLYHQFVKKSINSYGFGNLWKNIENMSDFFNESTKLTIDCQNKRIFDIVRRIIADGQREGLFNKNIDSLYASIAITAFTSGLDHSIFMHQGLLQELNIDIEKLLLISMDMINKCLQ